MLEKRKFSRITFAGKCTLNENISGALKTWQTELLDISLKGALVIRPADWQYPEDAAITLNLQLEGSDIVVSCPGTICHQEENRLGMTFSALSLESISHLKRLVQLNLGDDNLLHREMSQLIDIRSE